MAKSSASRRASMAQSAGGEKFRGSSELPLTPDGEQKAHQLGKLVAAKGGLDKIVASDLGRTKKTAEILSQYTHAPIKEFTKGLHPWHLGGLEGQKVTPDLLAVQNHHISNEPNKKLPGMGPKSTERGESFNDFRNRTGQYIQKLYDQHVRNPGERIGAVTHFRVLKLTQAALAKGTLDKDFSVDSKEMEAQFGAKGDSPGSLHRLYKGKDGKPMLEEIYPEKLERLDGGVYLIRHEATPWNQSTSSGAQS